MSDVTVVYQDYGTAILFFIQGKTEQDAYGKWLSLYNWGATSSEANFVAPNTIACWSTARKFQRYLFNIHLNRIVQNRPANVKGVMDDAVLATARAKEEFEATARESFRSVNSQILPFEMGEISAEEPDDDFASAVLSYAFSHHRDAVAV